MRISVTGTQVFRQLLGVQHPVHLDVAQGTIEDGLVLLASRYGRPLERMIFEPGKRQLKSSIMVLVNGAPHWNLPQRLATPLKDGDAIELRPMAAGG